MAKSAGTSKRRRREEDAEDGEQADADAPFFEDELVTVTRTRAIIAGTTYAMSNITSVRTFIVPKPFGVAIVAALLMLFGLFVAQSGIQGPGIGVSAVGVALLALYLWVLKPKYWVRIGTAGAESNAVWSNDAQWTEGVVDAINEAIVARG